jgi:hypothetical protein
MNNEATGQTLNRALLFRLDERLYEKYEVEHIRRAQVGSQMLYPLK